MKKDFLEVEVAYTLPDQQKIIRLQVAPGTTVAKAIAQSGIAQYFPEIDLSKNKVGVYGKLTSQDTVLRDRDRVEIYRSLISDPKEVRRKRAEERKDTKKGTER